MTKSFKYRVSNINEFLRESFGQSLFEVIIALGVIALILTSVVFLSTRSVTTSDYAQKRSEATQLAAETIEWLRLERRDWNDFRFFVSTGGYIRDYQRVWCLVDLSFNWPPSIPAYCSPVDYISGSEVYRREAEFSCYETTWGLPNPLGGVNCSDPNRVNLISVKVRIYFGDSQGKERRVNSDTYFVDLKEQSP